MTAIQFSDLQEFFVIVFGPILQWLLVGIAVGVTGLIILIWCLALLRRMLKSGMSVSQNL